MRKNREPLLSAEDVARIRAKYPNRAISRIDKITRAPKEPKTPEAAIVFSDDYKSLRLAVQDPRLPVPRAPLDSYSVVSVGFTGHVKKSHWVLLAWSERHGASGSSIAWGSVQCRVKDYLAKRYEPFESEKMLKWWDELLMLVPESYPVVLVPTNEDLVLQWKETERAAKGNQ